MKKTNAIGIFDSGIGGLTVGHQIAKLMPNEDIVYFGDTKHLPYGDKSPDAIIRFSKSITEFLLTQNCKTIVIACNTASALAFNQVKTICENKAIAINVIDPVVDYTCNSAAKKVGIIGTKNTIQSNVYADKINAKNTTIEALSLATPLLVPMIEEGFYQNKISNTIISNYLESQILSGIDHLILGCTHYPLIEEEISDYYREHVHVINSAKIVAQHVQSSLATQELLNSQNHAGSHQFYVSDYTQSFEQSAQNIFGECIQLEEKQVTNT
jgi:glutamate racemase